ncbi:OLC1v1031655C1 [Oldenlandia corymbosa var. corymbosa]|nr:OLC1v1031655C1 [Oldenlandia corymbosa var. corymbosa]
MASLDAFHSPFGSKLQIEAMQTVMPTKPTDPRQSIQVCLDENPCSGGILKRCFNIVMCYNKPNSGDETSVSSGSVVAGWIKESLGKALSEQPLLAGRLRPKQHDDRKGEMEIVSNDSGVRMIEARYPMTLAEFLDIKEKKETEEAELVFWEDLDKEQNPQFSPLFYVQVTDFSCGGYSVGISCSLLLNDPFAMITFLKRWTDTHIEMVSRADAPKIPIFYRPNLRQKQNIHSSALPFGTNTKPSSGQSVIFNISSEVLDLESDIHKKFADIYIDEAEQKLGQKTGPNLKVSLLLKEGTKSAKDVKVRNFTKDTLIQKPSVIISGSKNWDDLGVNDICFQEGNKPASVSCWINSVPDEALVMIVPSVEK